VDQQSTVNLVEPNEKVYVRNIDDEEVVETRQENEEIEKQMDDEKSEEDVTIEDDHLSAREQLNQLYGIDEIKKQIDSLINMLKFNQMRQEKGLETMPVTLHSFFIGNPGTGKTTLGRIIGKLLYEEGVISTKNFIEAKRKDLVGSYIG